MSDKFFVDTNVLVYAHDRGAGRKHDIARHLVERLWHDRAGVVSTQVLQELYINLRRKASKPLDRTQARQLVEDYLSWEVVVNDGRSILEAIEIEDRYGISFWDALVIQAARNSGAPTIYTEDLNHGQDYGGVEAYNPFLAIGEESSVHEPGT
jgi:predicted nucleic acid-binding protein